MVYQDIFESSYSYNYKGYEIYFSSLFNKERFIDRIENYILDENLKNINKYGVKIDLTNYLIVVLYKKLEKRGFRIYNKDNKLLEEDKIFII